MQTVDELRDSVQPVARFAVFYAMPCGARPVRMLGGGYALRYSPMRGVYCELLPVSDCVECSAFYIPPFVKDKTHS